MNPQADSVNQAIMEQNSYIFSLLSKKGREIFFPSKGILAQGQEASNKKINATIGMAMEDDGSPMRLESISQCLNISPKEAFPYAPSAGLPGLRAVWKKLILEKNPALREQSISTPVVCNALTHGLNLSGYLFVDPDDEIILPDLYWGNYNLVFQNAASARFLTFPLFSEGGFNINGLREKLLGRGEKKILILNFPNNPTGYTPTEQEMMGIIAAVKEAADEGKRIVIFCDDAYFGLVFEDGVFKESVFSALADLDERVLAVKIDGATKEDYVWGFRVGFLTFACKGMTPTLSSALENKAAGAIRASISSASRLSQSLLLKAYSSQEYPEEKKRKFQKIKARYEKVRKAIENNPRYRVYFTPLPFNSGYFLCFQLKHADGEKIRQILLERYDTGVIVIGTIIRVAYAAIDQKDIPEMMENLFLACKGETK